MSQNCPGGRPGHVRSYGIQTPAPNDEAVKVWAWGQWFVGGWNLLQDIRVQGFDLPRGGARYCPGPPASRTCWGAELGMV